MIKSFLILISLCMFLFASQQIVLVVAQDFNSSQAKLECFEGKEKHFTTMDVNLGKKGLGWGLGELELTKKPSEPLKYEGDKKAPAGIFKLSSIFGYSKINNFKMFYKQASNDLICVDDSNSTEYNKIISMPHNKPQSFEYMKREDFQYELGIVVTHNKDAIKKRGSCIFLHVQKEEHSATAGCTSMHLEDLRKITSWLDESKNPILIQIKKSSSKEILELYPQLSASKLLEKN